MASSGTQTDNTFVEKLRKLLSSITDLKTTNDADLPFAINLETMILQRLKGGADQAMQPGGQPGGGMPGGQPGQPGGMGAMPGGMPAGLMGTAAPPPGMGSPQGVPGLQQGPTLPNADELRRTLQNANIAHRLPEVAAKVSGI